MGLQGSPELAYRRSPNVAELPEIYRRQAERTGLVEVGKLPVRTVSRAIKTSLSTMDAAVRMFDALVRMLGSRAYLDPAAVLPARRLHLRDREDPTWLIPQPLIEIRPVAHRRDATLALIRTGPDLPSEERPDGWEPGDPPWFLSTPRPDIVPVGPTMFCGDLVLREGPAALELNYDDRGILCGSQWTGGDIFWAARAPDRLPYMIDASDRRGDHRPLSLLCRGDLHDDMTAEMLASLLIETLQPERVHTRVWLPVPVPGGPEGVRNGAMAGLRRAIGAGTPAGARVCVADAFAGTATSFGADLEEAMDRWAEEVWRCKPRPDHAVTPTSPPTTRRPDSADDEQGAGDADAADNVRRLRPAAVRVELGRIEFSFTPPPSAVPVPAFIPENTPAARVALPASWPTIPAEFTRAGFTRWVRLVGEHGTISHLLVREDPDRVTLVGEAVLDLVDPETLRPEIDRALDDERSVLRDVFSEDPETWRGLAAHNWFSFRVWNSVAQTRTFECAGGSAVHEFPFEIADGDELRWKVVCWIRVESASAGSEI